MLKCLIDLPSVKQPRLNFRVVLNSKGGLVVCSFKNLVLVLVLIASSALLGCGGGGGGGGGGGSPAATTTPTTTLSNSSTAKSFIAKAISNNYSTLNTQKQSYSIRTNPFPKILPEIKTESLGVGTAKLTYGPADSVTFLGVNYTYTGGNQIVQIKDTFGNLVDDTKTVNTLIITSNSLACTFYDSGVLTSEVINGKLAFSGFQSNTTFSVIAENLNIAGTINNTDSFSWTLNGNVSVDTATFPYPKKDQSETGSIVFNGAQYNYITTYDGTNVANCSISGAESINLKINMATGSLI